MKATYKTLLSTILMMSCATACQNTVGEKSSEDAASYRGISEESINDTWLDETQGSATESNEEVNSACDDLLSPAVRIVVSSESERLCMAQVQVVSETTALQVEMAYPGGACEYHVKSGEAGTYTVTAEVMGYESPVAQQVVIEDKDCESRVTKDVNFILQGETELIEDDTDTDVQEVPSDWTCQDSYYGTDDGCDCGCGIVDPDCEGITIESCDYLACDPGFSVDPIDITSCVETPVVDDTPPVTLECPEGSTPYEGDLVISTEDDLAQLNDYDCVAGHVTLSANDDEDTSLVEIDNETITHIAGDLNVVNTGALEAIRFRELLQIGGTLEVKDAPQLAEMGFDVLETITGSLVVGSPDGKTVPELDALDGLDQLVTVEGAFALVNSGISSTAGMGSLEKILNGVHIEDNDDLERIDLDSLSETQGDILIRTNGALDRIRVRALGSLNGELQIEENMLLDEIDARLLEEANGDVTLSQNLLGDLNFESLSAIHGQLTLSENSELETLEGFESLMQIQGNVHIQQNETLSAVSVESILGSCDIGGALEVCGNLDQSPCQ